MEKITIGSLFSGIGGFELGAQWALKNAGIPHKVLFQVEQNKYCQSILKKHWPNVPIFDDVRSVGRHNVKTPDILIGGFPCQSISISGNRKGLNDEKKSGIWFEMLRVISELRCRIVVLENVPNVLRLGGPQVIGGLAEIGYDCEWKIISARQFGAPHLRKRWFCIATDSRGIYSGTDRDRQNQNRPEKGNQSKILCQKNRKTYTKNIIEINRMGYVTNSDEKRIQRQSEYSKRMETKYKFECRISKTQRKNTENYWKKGAPVSPLCSVDDGIPDRMARLKALGNAIVPQCSEYIFNKLILSDYFQNFLTRRRHGKSTQGSPQIYERS